MASLIRALRQPELRGPLSHSYSSGRRVGHARAVFPGATVGVRIRADLMPTRRAVPNSGAAPATGSRLGVERPGEIPQRAGGRAPTSLRPVLVGPRAPP
jgi:hypothetical protein